LLVFFFVLDEQIKRKTLHYLQGWASPTYRLVAAMSVAVVIEMAQKIFSVKC